MLRHRKSEAKPEEAYIYHNPKYPLTISYNIVDCGKHSLYG